jgi:hypothetical protein
MDSKKLLEAVRQSAHQNRIWTPHRQTHRSWPLCLTCGREVEAVELKHVNAHGCELWAKCHGAEDFYKITFPYRVDGDPMADQTCNDNIRAAMLAFTPFDPTKPSK